MTPRNDRTAHLARALFADLDYVLGVDPNTLAAFCVRVLDEWDAGARAKGNGHTHTCLHEFGMCTCDTRVHNHGTEDGPGLACGERMVNGRLRGWCMDGAP